jgi:hypothetical protein
LTSNHLQPEAIVRTSRWANDIDAHTTSVFGIKALGLVEVVISEHASLLHLDAVVVFAEVGGVS